MADPDNVNTGGTPPPAPGTATGGAHAAAASANGVAAARHSDRSPWNWLLLVPIVLPLLTFLFNGKNPTLFGFPRFYWLQLAFVIVGVLATTLVYQATKARR